MNVSDVVAQIVSIFISALGLIVFRLIARFLPEDPAPVPRPPDTVQTQKAPPESDTADG